MNQSKFVPIFMTQLTTFIKKLNDRFPEESDISNLYTIVDILKTTQTVFIIKNYHKYVYVYKDKINAKDENFMINDNYQHLVDDNEIAVDKNELSFKIDYFKHLFQKKIDNETKENIWSYLILLNRLIDKINETKEIIF